MTSAARRRRATGQPAPAPKWLSSAGEARRILWMYTSCDVYRMLVREGGWTPDQYQAWLSDTLVKALVDPWRITGSGNKDLGRG